MAIDRWLLQQHSQKLHPPTLRFYSWSPPAISLGYHQQRWPQAWQSIHWRGQQLDLVRRPSGGRAVLHQGDLTYAIVGSGFGKRRWQAYQTLCQFLIRGWQQLGVELRYGAVGQDYRDRANCFSTATGADLVRLDGSKFIGSAQLRCKEAVLQHGSMQLAPEPDLYHQVFGQDLETPASPNIASLDLSEVETALQHAAEACFDMRLQVQPFSDAEWQAILAQPPLEVCPKALT